MTATASTPRWVIPLLALAALVAAGVAGLLLWHPDGPRPVTLYYGDAQAMYVVPVQASLELPAEPEPWARAVFEKLAHTPDAALVPVVTPEVKLLKAAYQAPVWSLELSMPAADGSALERLMVAAVVRSFVASYPGCQQVTLRLVGGDGKPYESQHLDLSRPLVPADVANRLEGPKNGLLVTLWWRLPGAGPLLPVQMPVAGTAGTPPADALARLVAGPPEEAGAFLAGVVPAGVHPRWAGLEQQTAAVTLDRPLPNGPEGRRFVEAVVLTLTELSGIEAVQFKLGQAPAGGAVGPYILSAPIARPALVNAMPASAWAESASR